MHITQELLQAALAPVTEAVVQHAFDSGGTEARLSASADSVVILSIEAPSTEDGLEWWSVRSQPNIGRRTADAEDGSATPPARRVPASILAPMAANDNSSGTSAQASESDTEAGWKIWGLGLRMKQLHSLKKLPLLQSVQGAGGKLSAASLVSVCDLRNNRLELETLAEVLEPLKLSPLCHLDLSLNHIGPTLSPLSADNSAHLTTLNLSQNLQERVVGWRHPALTSLDLSSNSLEELAQLDLPSLATLRLSNNQLTTLSGLRTGLPRLRTLDVGRNALVADGLRSLPLLAALTSLELSENKIEDAVVVADAIVPLESLRSLSLVDNECTSASDYKMLLLQNASIELLDYSPVSSFVRESIVAAMGANDMAEAVALHQLVGRSTNEYLSRIELERRTVESRMLAMHKQRSVLQQAFVRYSNQMEEELEQLVSFLLRKKQQLLPAEWEQSEQGGGGGGSGGGEAEGDLPRAPLDAAKLLNKLRQELDAAEATRKAAEEEAVERSEAALEKDIQSHFDEITPEEAMRQLALAKPEVWRRLKDEEARLRAERTTGVAAAAAAEAEAEPRPEADLTPRTVEARSDHPRLQEATRRQVLGEVMQNLDNFE